MASRLITHALTLPKAVKQAVVLALDAAVAFAAVHVSFYLRLGEWIVTGPSVTAGLIAMALQTPIFWMMGVYASMFRHSSLSSLHTYIRATAIYAVPFVAVFTFIGVSGVPRTVGLIQPILVLLGLMATRWLAAAVLGRAPLERRRGDQRTAIIYGAGNTGRQLAAAIATDRSMNVIGFLDDNASLQGRMIDRVPIYAPDHLPHLIEQAGLTDVLLAMPSARRSRRFAILDMMSAHPVRVRTVPAFTDLAHGRIAVSDLRDLDVEDLLGRPAIAPDLALLRKNITGKTVLVTGAGGSIGSELCRQVARLEPRELLLLDNSEFALYAIHRELETLCAGELTIVPLLGSVTDALRVRAVFASWRPDTVYHAAAYKHVPLVEHNPVEGIRNNVFGTRTLATCAAEAGVADFVLISTDKAVRPTNIMGSTKRAAELILQAMASQATRTRFAIVRFGNVLGSSGSVVPLFRAQIAKGGPLTVTHREMTRYFMTVPEASQLVIQAGAMASGGEVFVLDMGEPVRIIDLARNMITLSGLHVRDEHNPDGDIEISEIGLRPGEKLYEELLIGDCPAATAHPRIMKASEGFFAPAELKTKLDALGRSVERGNVRQAQARLLTLVPEYQAAGDVVDWVELHDGAGAKLAHEAA